MRKKIFALFLFIVLFVAACSSNHQDSSDKAVDYESNEIVQENYDSIVADDDDSREESGSEAAHEMDNLSTSNRMIIHQAYLSIVVKDIEEYQLKIEEKVNEYGGYIVNADVSQGDHDRVYGHITVRIPENNFNAFLTDTENQATDVLERSVTGEDVTEQYVDLESRVASKRVVEKRLLEFMDDAKKTEDLLAISNDLAQIQEEIEVIVGKMNYLENQVDYSTVEITMHEDRVVVPDLKNKNLNTWEKTTKQLATSINFILNAGSGLVVFFIGNLPIFIILFVIGIVIYLIFKRKMNLK